MAEPPRLTDRAALTRQRRRARAAPGGDEAFFLHRAVALDLQERLSVINRTFTAPAVVSPFPGDWPDFLPGAVQVDDAPTLSLVEGAHDLVVHALALHWADDPLGQLIQARRALKPDGLFLCACLGGRTLAELRAALAEAEAEITGGLSPRVAPMAEMRDLGALLQRAGFALPVVDAELLPVSYASAFGLMADLRAMGEGNALQGRLRHPTRPSVLRRAAEVYAEAYPAEGGRVTASFEVVTLTGWSPHESQQKPLRPGSAAARLAEALGTQEHGLDDPAGS